MDKAEVIAVFSEIWWQASRGECTFLSQHEHGEELPVWLARIEAAQKDESDHEWAARVFPYAYYFRMITGESLYTEEQRAEAYKNYCELRDKLFETNVVFLPTRKRKGAAMNYIYMARNQISNLVSKCLCWFQSPIKSGDE